MKILFGQKTFLPQDAFCFCCLCLKLGSGIFEQLRKNAKGQHLVHLPLGAFAARAPCIPAEQTELAVSFATTEAEAKAAGTPFVIGIGAELAMACRNDEPILVIGDSHIA